MIKSFEYKAGTSPVLISMPHNSSELPIELIDCLTAEALQSKDTDWFIDKLYDFSDDLGVHTIKPKWSRYYVDLNRDPSGNDLYPGASNTELCPTTDFSDAALYRNGEEPTHKQIELRIQTVWKPYHHCIEETLQSIVAEHGYAVLLDAHSIRSVVPRFFEGQLPDFNFGSGGGLSCHHSLMDKVEELSFEPWSRVTNGRFKGGYITRYYGDPANNIHALQLELSQATYLDESKLTWETEKAVKVKSKLKQLVQCLVDWKPQSL